MNWTKTKPTAPGYYYRTTEWARVVAVQVAQSMDGLIGDIGDGTKLIEKFSPYFFWIGPMPEPPDEANRVKRDRERLTKAPG